MRLDSKAIDEENCRILQFSNNFIYVFILTIMFYIKTSMCRGKTNFFEKRVGEYQKAGVMNSLGGDGNETHELSFNEDF